MNKLMHIIKQHCNSGQTESKICVCICCYLANLNQVLVRPDRALYTVIEKLKVCFLFWNVYVNHKDAEDATHPWATLELEDGRILHSRLVVCGSMYSE